MQYRYADMRPAASDWTPDQQLASGGGTSHKGANAPRRPEAGSTPGGIHVGERRSRSKKREERDCEVVVVVDEVNYASPASALWSSAAVARSWRASGKTGVHRRKMALAFSRCMMVPVVW